MTKFAIIAAIAASLALTACNAPERPEPVDATPIPPAPAEDVRAIGSNVTLDVPSAAINNITNVTGVNSPALRATTLGTLNGCRIDRVIVDGQSFVLVSAVRRGTTGQASAYGYASCNLEALG